MTHTHFRPRSFFLMAMLALLALPVWSQSTPDKQAPMEIVEIFRVVENMPSYPGCEHITNEASKDACTQRKVLEYLKTNMSYRPAAFEKNVDYVAVIQFLVSDTGLVYDMKVTKAPDEESRAALLSALQSMASRMLFTPGTQRGRPITFIYRMQVDLKKLAGK